MLLLARAFALAAFLLLTSNAQASTCLTSNAFRESQATVEACSTELKGSNLAPSQQQPCWKDAETRTTGWSDSMRPLMISTRLWNWTKA